MSQAATASVLSWPGRVLAEDDLRRHWSSQSEIVLGLKTIVTPLAWDFLKSKRVAIRREQQPTSGGAGSWGIAVEGPSVLVASVVKSLAQDGQTLIALENARGDVITWIRMIAALVVRGQPPGAVIVSEHPGLAACVANKIPGLRAVAASQAAEIGALKMALGPNVIVFAALGHTYFELRQLLKLATASPPSCPEAASKSLRELDGHAHR
jgi:hypothetical protein